MAPRLSETERLQTSRGTHVPYFLEHVHLSTRYKPLEEFLDYVKEKNHGTHIRRDRRSIRHWSCNREAATRGGPSGYRSRPARHRHRRRPLERGGSQGNG